MFESSNKNTPTAQTSFDNSQTRRMKSLRQRLMAISTELQHVSQEIERTTAIITTPKAADRNKAECSVAELAAALKDLISRRPLSLKQLARYTGADKQRISNTLVKLKHEGALIVNVGKPRKAKWLIAA